MLYGHMGQWLQSCHLSFLKKKMPHGLIILLHLHFLKRIKSKKRCLSLFESVTVQFFFFFSLLISTTQVFSLELFILSYSHQSFLLFTLQTFALLNHCIRFFFFFSCFLSAAHHTQLSNTLTCLSLFFRLCSHSLRLHSLHHSAQSDSNRWFVMGFNIWVCDGY